MKPKQAPKFDGPIPGENYTSNRKNYPWHRPPELTDYVDIVDAAIEALQHPTKQSTMVALMDSGETILDLVTGMVRVNMSKGKAPLDQSILAAGPVARFLELIADEAGIDYERGWEQEDRIVTKAMLTGEGGDPIMPDLPTLEEEPSEDTDGFMSVPKGDPAMQEKMLGGL